MTTATTTRFLIRGHRSRCFNIAVTGVLDDRAADSLRFLLVNFEQDRVVLDLTECAALSDTALDALVAASRAARARGGSLDLRPTTRPARAEVDIDLSDRRDEEEEPLPRETFETVGPTSTS
jgi:anti-anti-sigma regulatory factor